MSQTDWEQWRRDRQEKNQQALEKAKREALVRGKEPFCLDKLDAAWPLNPDFRGEPIPSRESRIADWENQYYTVYVDTLTIAEFAASLKISQSYGAFD